jgi:hypothetical protein
MERENGGEGGREGGRKDGYRKIGSRMEYF